MDTIKKELIRRTEGISSWSEKVGNFHERDETTSRMTGAPINKFIFETNLEISNHFRIFCETGWKYGFTFFCRLKFSLGSSNVLNLLK